MLKKISVVFFLIAVLSVSELAAAGPPPPPPPVNIPIDGGVSFLIAAGAAYGIKKMRDSRKKNS